MDGSRSWWFFETPVWHVDAARGPSTPSLDHLVGASEQHGGHLDPEHPGGVGVDDKLDIRSPHDWEVCRLGALENAAGVDAELAIRIANVGSVTHQAADFSNFTLRIGRGKPVERSQLDQLHTPTIKERKGTDEQGIGLLARHSFESGIDLALSGGVDDLDSQPHGASGRF